MRKLFEKLKNQLIQNFVEGLALMNGNIYFR